MAGVLTWREAMETALYGPSGFFARQAPSAHFRTSATASPWFAAALSRLVERVDIALGGPARFDVVDVGAGRGELLLGLASALPADLRRRAAFVGVERAARPETLPEWIEWRSEPPAHVTGMLLATEWLDNVPLDVAEVAATGERRLVLVDPQTGAEHLDGPVTGEAAAWLERYWPGGYRAEVGCSRDAAWAAAVATVDRGLAVAVDYGHLASSRPVNGTLTGFRDGREVAPVPDGSCDVTAHVAMDSVAAAGAAVAGTPPALLTQREALRALGVDGSRPPLELASRDPAGYVKALAAATQAAELLDPHGLGAHYWLLQPSALILRDLGLVGVS